MTAENFDRFHQAQAPGFENALKEIRAGRKRSHWIWYILPQIAGLGHSSMAQFYALRDLAEARAYLRDPVLSSRYAEIAQAAAEQLEGGAALETLMGSPVDALKLVSSLTLFREAAKEEHPALAELCDELLQFAAAQNYLPCAFTTAQLTRG